METASASAHALGSLRSIRRVSGWAAGFVLTALISSVAVPATAGADQISDKQKEADRVAKQLESLRTKASQLDEALNQAKLKFDAVSKDVDAAKATVADTEKAIQATQARAVQWAVENYVSGGAADPMLNLLSGTGSANEVLQRTGYASAAVGRDQDIAGQLRSKREDSLNAQSNLAAKLAKQDAAKRDLDKQRKALDSSVASQQKLLSKTKSEVTALIRADEERKAAEAAAAARAAAQAAEAARRAAVANLSIPKATPAKTTKAKAVAPPPSPGAAGAVAAAISQLGVPYRFATAIEGVNFDCSGLTLWAWGRSGHQLPHSAEMQYRILPKVDREDLEPGDLVFFGSPIHHVGMYVGNGMMINAPQTGDVVKYASIDRRDYAGAARP